MNNIKALTKLLSSADKIAEGKEDIDVVFSYSANSAAFQLYIICDGTVHKYNADNSPVNPDELVSANTWLNIKAAELLTPRSIRHQGKEFPNVAFTEAPKVGTTYCVPDPLARASRSVKRWEGSIDDIRYLKQGLCYPQTITGEAVAIERGRLMLEYLLS